MLSQPRYLRGPSLAFISLYFVVYIAGDKAAEATSAGADEVGTDDLVARIQEGWLEFDAAIATPDQMAKIGRIARILGPRGLMPNPKTGTGPPPLQLQPSPESA